MGLFDKIFGQPKPKTYSLDEAIKIIENELHSLQSANKEEQYRTAMQVHSEMEKLYSLIGDFSRKDVPAFAKSSANVKERFCSISIRQINSLPEPSGDEPWKYLQSTQNVLNSLGGLTQRQIIHINFFFKDDFSLAARKINEINALLSLRQKGHEHMKSVEMYKKIKGGEKRKKELSESILHNQEKFKKLNQQKSNMPKFVEHIDTHNLEAAEKDLKTVRQDIDSFLGIQKLLKKYAYEAELKDNLLEIYIESPNHAILEDENLRILDYVRSAALLIKEGKINENLPEKKTDTILASADYLHRKREELIKAIELVKTEQKTLRGKRDTFEEQLKEHNNLLAHFEGEIKDVTRVIEREKEEEGALSKELAHTYSELCMLASKLLNANVS
ncbi:MAG TPA: hypothetical protein HA230_02145 [Candidatus Aenigmarchaeota archaeon]|nr:hypothetical protein [Candidatus Aenigmarchaeota archaeon]